MAAEVTTSSPYMSVSRLVARHTNVTCRQKRFKSLLISLVFPLAT